MVEKLLGRQSPAAKEAEDESAVTREAPIADGSVGLAQGALIGGPLYAGACCAIISLAAAGAGLRAIALAGVIGGTVGGLLVIWCKGRWQRRMRDRFDRFSLVLKVHIQDEEHEDHAEKILARHPAHDVQLSGAIG